MLFPKHVLGTFHSWVVILQRHPCETFLFPWQERLESTRSEVEEHEEDQKLKVSVWRIMKMNFPEWPYILVGVISAAGMGASMPVYAILFGDVLGVSFISLSGSENYRCCMFTSPIFLHCIPDPFNSRT